MSALATATREPPTTHASAAAASQPDSAPEAWPDSAIDARLGLALLAAIVLVALFLRLYRLDSWPPIHIDEAITGRDAIDLFRRDLDLLNPSFTHYLAAALLPLFALLSLTGPSLEAVRILAVLYGIGAVIGCWWAGRVFFGNTAGLLAASILATSHVAVAMSRFGGINSQGLFLAVLCFATFGQAIKSGGRWWAVWGAVIGLGAYSYEGFRIVPVVIVLALVLSPRLLWRRRRDLAVAFAVFLVVASPLLVRFAQDPDAYLAEPNRQTVLGSPDGFLESYGTDSVFVVIREQFKLSFRYFIDGHNRDTQYMFRGPGFDGFMRALFFAGLIVALVRVRDLGYRAALLWFWLGLLFGSAMTESPPLAPRLAMLLPPAALLAGGALGQGLDRLPADRRRVIAAAVIVLVSFELFIPNYRNYFERYSERDVYWPWVEPQRAIGEYVAALPADAHVLLLRTPGVWSEQAIVDFVRRSGPGSDAPLRDVDGWESSDFDPASAAGPLGGPPVHIIAPAEAVAGLGKFQWRCPGRLDQHHGPMGLGGESALQFSVLSFDNPDCLKAR